jgi:signal transduction histidine kinase
MEAACGRLIEDGMNTTPTTLWRLDTLGDPVLDSILRCLRAATGCATTRIHWFEQHDINLSLPDGVCAVESATLSPFCTFTLLSDDAFEVPDATQDPLFDDHPIVRGDQGVRYYAGVPLRMRGVNVATLCVMDHQARQLDRPQMDALRDMGCVIEHWMRSAQEHKAQLLVQALERANQARSAFVTRMSHELRTPLNAVLGFTQLIQAEASLPTRVHDYLIQVRKGADHLLNLVSDILELSRTQQGAVEMRAEPVALHPALMAQLAQIEPLARQRGVRLQPVRGDTDAVVLADERALGQVLLNLLSNAVKYNRENGTLTVEIHSHEEHIALSVSDQGRGLTPVQQQRLFRPFDRLGAENSNTPGTGLGLVISKHLTEAMQGRLVAHAGVEGGCRFEISLPAHLPLAA